MCLLTQADVKVLHPHVQILHLELGTVRVVAPLQSAVPAVNNVFGWWCGRLLLVVSVILYKCNPIAVCLGP